MQKRVNKIHQLVCWCTPRHSPRSVSALSTSSSVFTRSFLQLDGTL
jgi:hypothetical protein